MAHLEEILQKLGWDTGFQMPIANVENQALEEELAKLAFKKLKVKATLTNANAKLEALKEHFKFVTQENEQTQKLITAHRQQIDTESNTLSTLKAEKSRIEHDIGVTNKNVKTLEERQVVHKNDLQRAIVKAEKMKEETGWDIEALQAWEEALKKRDEDNELIKKFSKEDERKFNELEAKRQLLQNEFDSKTEIVNKLVRELQGDEMTIERSGKAMKQQLNERDTLVERWKEAVQMLQQRDNDISNVQDDILVDQEVLEKQIETLEEEKGYFAIEIKNNKEIDLEIEGLSALNSRMRRDLGQIRQQVLTMHGELQALKREVSGAANILENERVKSKRLTKELHEKEQICIKYQEDIVKLEKKLEDMKGNTMSSAEQLDRLQKSMEVEQKQRTLYISDTKKIDAAIYRAQLLLKEHRDLGKRTELEVENAFFMCNKLRKHITDQQQTLEKLKWVVYDMDFKIDEFEQKLCKLEGSSRQEEHSDERDEKIREMEQTLYDYLEVQHTLQGQVDRLQDEMRRLTNFIAADNSQMLYLQDKIENHTLEFEIGKKQIAGAQQSTQENQVEENLMRLRINHIEENMTKENQKIYNLEKMRLMLDEAMKERQIEIDTSKAILLTKKRALDEDKGRLRGDIVLRKVKMDQLKKKYHIEVMALGKDKDGQPYTVTHFKIKNAQEKYMLQQQGDELDVKIKKAEKEIVAMENTLKVVNLTNLAFKNNLTTVEENDEEIKQLEELEQQLRTATSNLKRRKEEYMKKEATLKESMQKLKEIEEHKDALTEKMTRLQDDSEEIRRQQYAKQEKLERAEAQVKTLLRKLKNADISKYMEDLETRHLRDVNKAVLKKFVGIMEEYPEVSPLIHRYTIDMDIDLPSHKTPSSSSSSYSSSSSREDTFRSFPGSQVNVNKVEISWNL